jgi:hypothetical protein
MTEQKQRKRISNKETKRRENVNTGGILSLERKGRASLLLISVSFLPPSLDGHSIPGQGEMGLCSVFLLDPHLSISYELYLGLLTQPRMMNMSVSVIFHLCLYSMCSEATSELQSP